MSEQKWAVLKDEDRIWWLVVQPCDVCRYDGMPECWDVHSHYSTWAEAMQEANRMARPIGGHR